MTKMLAWYLEDNKENIKNDALKMSYREMQDKYGVSETTIRAFLRDKKIPKRDGRTGEVFFVA